MVLALRLRSNGAEHGEDLITVSIATFITLKVRFITVSIDRTVSYFDPCTPSATLEWSAQLCYELVRITASRLRCCTSFQRIANLPVTNLHVNYLSTARRNVFVWSYLPPPPDIHAAQKNEPTIASVNQRGAAVRLPVCCSLNENIY